MKIIALITLLILIYFNVFSQNEPLLNIGTNFQFFGNSQTGTYSNIIKSMPSFYIEKPIKINLFNINSLNINPGITYFNINESNSYGRSSHSVSRNVTHKSYSCYIKIIKKSFIEGTNTSYYFGTLSGIHFKSNSQGEKNSITYSFGDNIYDYRSKEIIENKRKSDFFHLVYNGLIFGIEPNISNIKWLTVGFEFKFLPLFGQIKIDSYQENVSGIECSMNIGFGK